ncbi:hypothetical protein [Actinosynnema sp. ALI-1.44]|uniref:hypothetical protein n=1 Tax=Actinosynnema sp. ALI-1.44 TaxID=1933779 RepID=UPI001177CC1F|nr:hypothetical protein [Actinosynnema sp. ALI-1.44]
MRQCGDDAARKLNPGGLAIEIEPDLARLPLYDQDLDTETPPAPVAALPRSRCSSATLGSPATAS